MCPLYTMIHRHRSWIEVMQIDLCNQLLSSRCLPFSWATCTLSLQACEKALLETALTSCECTRAAQASRATSSAEKPIVILLHSYHAHSYILNLILQTNPEVQRSKGPKWFQGLEESLHGSPQLISQGGLQERLQIDFRLSLTMLSAFWMYFAPGSMDVNKLVPTSASNVPVKTPDEAPVFVSPVT